MVRPIKHVVLGGAVEALERILGRSRKVKGLQTKVLQAGVEVLETRDKAVAAQVVVGIPEDLDVGMEGFEGVLGVLRLSALRATRFVEYLTIEFTVFVSPGPIHTHYGPTHTSRPAEPPCTRSR